MQWEAAKAAISRNWNSRGVEATQGEVPYKSAAAAQTFCGPPPLPPPPPLADGGSGGDDARPGVFVATHFGVLAALIAALVIFVSCARARLPPRLLATRAPERPALTPQTPLLLLPPPPPLAQAVFRQPVKDPTLQLAAAPHPLRAPPGSACGPLYPSVFEFTLNTPNTSTFDALVDARWAAPTLDGVIAETPAGVADAFSVASLFDDVDPPESTAPAALVGVVSSVRARATLRPLRMYRANAT